MREALPLLMLTWYMIVFPCSQLARNEGKTRVQAETRL